MLETIGKWFARRQIAKFETAWNYDMSYARDMLEASFPSFRGFAGIIRLAGVKGVTPPAAMYAVKIATTMAEDCGPCAQLTVSMAEREGIDAKTLRAIVAGDVDAMPRDAALGYRFAKATLAHDLLETDALRAEIERRWGKAAAVEMALAIAMSRTFPTIKYALGHGHACQQVRVAGAAVPVMREPFVREGVHA
jgi:hypothetical protein